MSRSETSRKPDTKPTPKPEPVKPTLDLTKELELLRAVEATATEVAAHVADPGHLPQVEALQAALAKVKRARVEG